MDLGLRFVAGPPCLDVVLHEVRSLPQFQRSFALNFLVLSRGNVQRIALCLWITVFFFHFRKLFYAGEIFAGLQFGPTWLSYFRFFSQYNWLIRRCGILVHFCTFVLHDKWTNYFDDLWRNCTVYYRLQMLFYICCMLIPVLVDTVPAWQLSSSFPNRRHLMFQFHH